MYVVYMYVQVTETVLYTGSLPTSSLLVASVLTVSVYLSLSRSGPSAIVHQSLCIAAVSCSRYSVALALKRSQVHKQLWGAK